MEYNITKSTSAQNQLQGENGYPDFAPSNGICYKCRRNIYEQSNHKGHVTGVTVEQAATDLITGCPHCNISYCD